MVPIASIIITVVLFLMMILSVGCTTVNPGGSSGSTREPGRPNIVLVVTDDQYIDTIADMEVINEQLIGDGVNFTNGFLTTPLCSPSRASILTGQYAHNHNVIDNRMPNGGVTVFDDTSTIATWLQEGGYRTAMVGKYLHDYDTLEPTGYIPPGWDEWQVFYNATKPHRYYRNYEFINNGELVQYGTSSSDYSTDVLTDKAAQFIRDSKNEPFFLTVNYFNPHQPHQAAKRHDDLYRDDLEIMARLRPSFNEEDVSDKPAWLQEIAPLNAELKEYNVSVYQRSLRSLVSVDEGIGELLETLEEIGQRDNTMFIFITDNGLTMGEHRLSAQKNCPYEECIKTPFIVSYPDMIESPREDDRLVTNIDLAPTIADLAGVEPPPGVDGVSLVPLLNGTAEDWRTGALFEHYQLKEGFGGIIPDYQGVRTQKWKYVVYDTGEVELYDLENDPYEMENLAAVSGYESILEELAQQLETLLNDGS